MKQDWPQRQRGRLCTVEAWKVPRWIAVASLMLLLTGCADDRLIHMARESADRQAQQNQVVAQVIETQNEVQKEVVEAHRDLQQERGQLAEGWNDLESERRSVASGRRTESLLTIVARGTLGAMVALLSLAFACCLLFGLSTSEPGPDELCQLLMRHTLIDGHKILPPAPSAERISDIPRKGLEQVDHPDEPTRGTLN